MKKIKKIMNAVVIAMAGMMALTGCSNASDNKIEKTEKDGFFVVSSFYPMHILAMNLTDGIDGVSEISMSDPNMGCIHDHTFTTDDLKKIENADVFIENGLNLETFNDKIKEAYPDMAVIEASEKIAEEREKKEGAEDESLHVWTSLDNYLIQIETVGEKLMELDPAHKEAYEKNMNSYEEKVNQLKEDYKDRLAALEGKKVLVLEETLPPFCEFVKLDPYMIETDHEQESLSADEIRTAIDLMKENGVKTILIAKGADSRNAQVIAEETGASIIELNTCMTGTEDKNAYLDDMKENFDTILSINK